MLSSDTAVIAETGDSWFNCQKLKLPIGCGYEFQMQYGSIGWSVGATLGYAQGAKEKRVISCIGDGSFQVNSTSHKPVRIWTFSSDAVVFFLLSGSNCVDEHHVVHKINPDELVVCNTFLAFLKKLRNGGVLTRSQHKMCLRWYEMGTRPSSSWSTMVDTQLRLKSTMAPTTL